MRQELAILFADISDSSRLYREMGDEAASAVVRGVLDALERVVGSCRGRVLDRIGDELMCAFPDAGVAVEAAVSLQAEMDVLKEREGQAIAIRVGLHSGEVVERDGRFFGDCIYIAKRLTDTAKAGQVVVAEETRASVGPEPYEFRLLDTQTLKGQAAPTRIFELLWNTEDATIMLGHEHPLLERLCRTLVLQHSGGGRVEVAQGQSITIGRVEPCDLVVPVPGVSRLHAKIEERKGRFVLIDLSTNGTYVAASDRATPRCVHRDHMTLPDRGLVGLGAEPGIMQPHTLPFLSRAQDRI